MTSALYIDRDPSFVQKYAILNPTKERAGACWTIEHFSEAIQDFTT